MQLVILLSLSSGVLVPSGTTPHKFAAVSLLETPSEGLRIRLGVPSKHPASPLLVQEKIWEAPPSRIDNGYPNVVPPLGQGQGQGGGDSDSYQLWYGSKAWDGTRHRSVLLYANSTDGLR